MTDLAPLRAMYGPWGIAEVSRYLRVPRDTVNKWRSRTTGFPGESTMSGNPWWWPDTVDDWAAATGRIPGFAVMASTGAEEPDGRPAWLTVDDTGCAIGAVPYREGDTAADGIGRLVQAGLLPPVALTRTETVTQPYPRQPPHLPYRWHLDQTRLPRSAAQWASALDALMAATGQTPGDLISHGYADGTLAWVPLDPGHPDADDERGVIVSTCGWTLAYNPHTNTWTEKP